METAILPIETTNFLTVDSVQEIVRKDSLLVPGRYVRDDEERPSANLLSQFSSQTPTIDFSLLSKGDQHEFNKFEMACRDWGFFQIINHGVAEDLMKGLKFAIGEFFNLPLEEKQKYAKELHGTQGYGLMALSEEQKLDWVDALVLSVSPHSSRNLNAWPKTPPEFIKIFEEYSNEVRRLSKELLANLSTLMGEDRPVLEKLHGDLMQIVRINYYPKCSSPDQVLGLSPHSDSNTITILLQDDDVTGLHIRHAGGWVPIDPIPNALIVNIGDCIEIWSNGKYKSIEHRAITNKYKPRISVASFIEPAMDALVEPLPQMVDFQEHLVKYKKIKYGDYYNNYLAKKLQGKTHTDFAKTK